MTSDTLAARGAPELLPCPFCGGEAHIDGTSWTTRDGKDQAWATCKKCGMLGNFCVCEVASSFAGPTRYGFTAPVLDPECDDEEFVHFATHEEAMKAAKERTAALRGEREPK